MNKYFPESQGISHEQQLDRPKWAKGAQLTQEALEVLPTKPPRPDPRRQGGNSTKSRDLKWVKALAAEHTSEAVSTLASIMKNTTEDGKTRVAAAIALLDRAWGKPTQEVTTAGGLARPQTDPEALHARIIAVVAAVGTAPESRQLREVIDAEPVSEAE